MANVVTKNKNGFSVVLDGSTVYDIAIAANGLSRAHADGLPVQSIELHPAGDTTMYVLEGGISGRKIMQVTGSTGNYDFIKYFNHEANGVKRFKLYLPAAAHASGDLLFVEF